MDNTIAGASYAEALAAFRWRVPERYNIAVDACDAWAAREPDRPAIVEMTDEGPPRILSYGGLAARSSRLANAFAAHGIGRGDRIAVFLPQTADVAVTHMAIYRLGAVAVPLASVFGFEAIRYRLLDAGARAIVTTREGAARLAMVCGELPDLSLVVTIDGPADATVAIEAFIAPASDVHAPADTGPEDPAMMIYTSGTTGQPKGALHGHRVLLGHIPGVQMHHDLLPHPGDRLWTPADWAWAGGLLNVLLPGLKLGVPVVAYRFETRFDPERAGRLMAEAQVRNAFIPPTALRMMRAAPPPKGLSLRSVGSGGEQLGSDTFDWGRSALGVTVNEFYGQTECNLVLSSSLALGVSRKGAIGLPVPGHRVAVIRPDGSACEPGETGTIAIQRPDPVMFLGYWGKPDATREKFLGDFLLTGDQGAADPDGYVSFVGRDDDVITSSGYRIGPGEIEDCLAGHPGVAVAAVVGKPDPVRTEIVKAFVMPADGFEPSDALAEDIRAYVRERLSAHEYPREIAFVDEIPLTATGKVIRRFFRDEVRAEAARAAGDDAAT